MIDFRIYATIYIVCLALYIGGAILGMVTLSKERAQSFATLVVLTATVLGGLTAVVHALDRLWS